MLKLINSKKFISCIVFCWIPCFLMLLPLKSEAQFTNFLNKQIENLSSQLTSPAQVETSKAETVATIDQSEAVSTIRDFGLIGAWGRNCQDINSIINYKIENNKVVARYQRPDATTYAIIDKAKQLNDKQLHYISQIYSTSNNQPLRKMSVIIYKNDGKTSVVYLEVIADGKSEITVKDGISLKDNIKQPFSSKCS